MMKPDSFTIATEREPNCYLCGTKGEHFYQDLHDQLFGAPGSWNLKKCPNPHCGLAWLDPMPSPEEIAKAYRNYYTHQETAPLLGQRQKNKFLKSSYDLIKNGYLAMRYGYPTIQSSWQKYLGLLLFLFPWRRKAVDRKIMGLRMVPGGRLLDVGCGKGHLLANFKELGWQVEGVEVDPEAAELARGKHLEVRSGKLGEQHYPDNCFDVITMVHVIEHVHDLIGLLRECRRILKVDGCLILITPNVKSLGHLLFKDAWRGLEPPRHLFLYTRRSLRAAANHAGLAIKSMHSSPLGAPFIYADSRIISRRSKINSSPISTIVERLRGRAFFWLEQASILLNPDLGEELVLIGTK